MKYKAKDKFIAYLAIGAILTVLYLLSWGEAGEMLRELIKEAVRDIF